MYLFNVNLHVKCMKRSINIILRRRRCGGAGARERARRPRGARADEQPAQRVVYAARRGLRLVWFVPLVGWIAGRRMCFGTFCMHFGTF